MFPNHHSCPLYHSSFLSGEEDAQEDITTYKPVGQAIGQVDLLPHADLLAETSALFKFLTSNLVRGC
jgi:hypothetical protein